MTYDEAKLFYHGLYDTAMVYHNIAYDLYYEATIAFDDGNDHLALQKIISAFASLHNCVLYSFTIDNFPELPMEYDLLAYLELYFNTTMEKMLEAMTAAKFEELKEFTGLTDAYKAALWNAPFEVDFYAGLVRHFKGEAGW